MSYCGLVDANISAPEKELPVLKSEFNSDLTRKSFQSKWETVPTGSETPGGQKFVKSWRGYFAVLQNYAGAEEAKSYTTGIK